MICCTEISTCYRVRRKWNPAEPHLWEKVGQLAYIHFALHEFFFFFLWQFVSACLSLQVFVSVTSVITPAPPAISKTDTKIPLRYRLFGRPSVCLTLPILSWLQYKNHIRLLSISSLTVYLRVYSNFSCFVSLWLFHIAKGSSCSNWAKVWTLFLDSCL